MVISQYLEGYKRKRLLRDLGVRRRLELKSDEFFFCNPLDVEILRCEQQFTAEKVLHLFGALPRDPAVPETRAAGGRV